MFLSLSAAAENFTVLFTKTNWPSAQTYASTYTSVNAFGGTKWKTTGGANNQKQWDYFKFGAKKTTSDNIIESANAVSIAVEKVVVNVSSWNVNTGVMNSATLYVSDNSSYTNATAIPTTVLSAAGKLTFDISTPKANQYYKIVMNISNTTNTNGVISVDKIDFTESTGGGSAVAPTTITFDPATDQEIDANTPISLKVDTESPCEIRYAINETATKTSAVYGEPFTLSEVLSDVTGDEYTVNAIAWNSANENNPVEASATYTIKKTDTPPSSGNKTATVIFKNQSDLTYAKDKTIIWTAEDNTTKFETSAVVSVNSSYPAKSSDYLRLYILSNNILTVNAPADYYFVSVSPQLPTGTQNVSFKAKGSTADPTEIATSGAVCTFDEAAKVRAFEIRPVQKNKDHKNSNIVSLTIVLAKLGPDKVATPTFSIPAGSVEVGESVTISCTTEGATLMGNITGLDENGNTTIVNVNLENETIPYTYTFTKKGVYSFEVLASKAGFDESDVATADYTVVNPKVATPTFSVASGSTVEEGESVTIDCATEGAKISGTVNDIAITDEELPYTYTFEKAGSYTIKVVASKADFDNSDEATATYTVTEFAAPANPVFSVSDAQPTPSGTVVTISAEGATSLTVNTYGIDGYVAKTDVIEGNTATVTVDKMHRRFAAFADREANGNASASEEVEAFYTIGNRTAATDNYTLVTSASELYDGMEFVMGVEGTNNVVMTTSKNNYDRVWYGGAATFANNEVTSLPTNALILVLEKAADGNWNIRTKDAISYYDNADEEKAMRDTPRIGYFYSYALTTTSNYMQMSASPKASATIKYNDADGVGNATISFSKVAENQPYMIIRYNTNTNGGFAMYMETESANSYPLPRIYAKKTAVAEDNGYKMSFHHTPYKANGSVQAKVVAATSHSNETVLNGTVNKDGTSYTFTTKEVQNLCGKFYVKIEKEELGGHISEAVVDFSDCNNKSCTAEDHSPFVHVGNKEEKKLVLAKHEDSVPLSTNPHGRLWLHTNPEVTVTLDPFRSIKMSLASDKVTGVDDITVDSADAEVEYYNLQGIRVANPEHGIYIRRQGNTATKVRL